LPDGPVRRWRGDYSPVSGGGGPPAGRFFRFYTDPNVTVCMPADEPAGLGGSCFGRVQEVMRVGGFHTFNLG
jgi:hypothetical protein